MGNLPTLETESGDYFLFNLTDCANFWTKSPEMAVGSQPGASCRSVLFLVAKRFRRLFRTFCPEIRRQEIGV
jgi:hypothetical protein